MQKTKKSLFSLKIDKKANSFTYRLKIAKELEQYFSAKFGTTYQSDVWQHKDGSPVTFYTQPPTSWNDIMQTTGAYDNVERTLLNGDLPNICLFRAVGASKGITVKTDIEHMDRTSIERYVFRLMNAIDRLYRNEIEKVQCTAEVTLTL